MKFLLPALLSLACMPISAQVPKDTRALDDYLEQREAKIPDITPNTEKRIFWVKTPGEVTPVSLVYLHGFSATRQETAPLTKNVAVSLGANVFYTRLTGHGRTGEAMLDGSVRNWYADALEAYDIASLIGKKVILVSVSTGGTLATWLANEDFTTQLSAMILISPNFELPNPQSDLIDLPFRIGVFLAEQQVGKEHVWEPHNELQAKYWTHRYPLRVLRELVRLVKQVRVIDKSKITTPLLVIYSPNDQVVSVSAIEKTYGEFGSPNKKLVKITEAGDPSNHVLAGDILSPHLTERLAQEIARFIATL